VYQTPEDMVINPEQAATNPQRFLDLGEGAVDEAG
jgi:hypothetical protein